jgi:quercetin dioxygenase-like cupin family protein
MSSFSSVAARFATAGALIMCVATAAEAAPGVNLDPAVRVVVGTMTKGAGAIVRNATMQSSSASKAAPQPIATPVATSEHPPESVKPVFERAIPNLPGKKLIAVLVNYPPAGKSRSHHHAKSAFIYAYVLSGSIRSAVGAEPARIYRAGESFYEEPGAHHLVSENASETEPASLLAVFLVEAGDQPLTVPDAEPGK